MRLLKFRAYDVENKKWITDETMIDSEGAPMFWEGSHGKEISIQQFTGLIDKNGKEIWEGDRVMVRSQYETEEPIESENTVYFRDGAFRCGFHNMNLGEKVCTGSEGNWNMEVVGNIHDNKLDAS
jgi:uncharacterized phage protein (TIGR01671 family)